MVKKLGGKLGECMVVGLFFFGGGGGAQNEENFLKNWMGSMAVINFFVNFSNGTR